RGEARGRGVRLPSGFYAQPYTRRYGRKGHLFGDRFWSGLIEDDDQFRDTCAYVLANPVRAGLCVEPADWPWNGSRTDRTAWQIVAHRDRPPGQAPARPPNHSPA